MKGKLFVLTLNIIALALLLTGIYGEVDGALRVAIFMYWIVVTQNVFSTGLLGMGLVLILATDWDEASEDAYKSLVEISFWERMCLWLPRYMCLVAIILLIIHEFVWLPAFFAASIILVLVTLQMNIGVMEMKKEKAAKLKEMNHE